MIHIKSFINRNCFTVSCSRVGVTRKMNMWKNNSNHLALHKIDKTSEGVVDNRFHSFSQFGKIMDPIKSSISFPNCVDRIQDRYLFVLFDKNLDFSNNLNISSSRRSCLHDRHHTPIVKITSPYIKLIDDYANFILEVQDTIDEFSGTLSIDIGKDLGTKILNHIENLHVKGKKFNSS